MKGEMKSGEERWKKGHLCHGILKPSRESLRRWAVCTSSLVEQHAFELGQTANNSRGWAPTPATCHHKRFCLVIDSATTYTLPRLAFRHQPQSKILYKQCMWAFCFCFKNPRLLLPSVPRHDLGCLCKPNCNSLIPNKTLLLNYCLLTISDWQVKIWPRLPRFP